MTPTIVASSSGAPLVQRYTVRYTWPRVTFANRGLCGIRKTYGRRRTAQFHPSSHHFLELCLFRS
jgi:hypothetical protein